MPLTPITTTPPGQPLTGTVIASNFTTYNNTDAGPAKAFDGNAGTFCDLQTADACWIGLDLGKPFTLQAVSITFRKGYETRLQNATIEGANNTYFSDTKVLATIQTPNAGTQTLVFASPGEYRYVRLNCPAHSHANCAGFVLRGVPVAALLVAALPVAAGTVEVLPQPWMPQERDAEGFSIIPPHSINIYVDSNSGSDSDAGTITAPLKTQTAAYRKMKPGAAMFLKRGSVFHENVNAYWTWNGSAGLVYGDPVNPLPLTISPAGNFPNGIHIMGANGVIIQGWRHTAENRDPALNTYDLNCSAYGINIGGSASNIFIEGVEIWSMFKGMIVGGGVGQPIKNVVVRRPVIYDCHSGKGNPANMFLNYVENFSCDEFLLDHGGWMQYGGKVYGQPKSGMDHNVYGDCGNDVPEGPFSSVDSVKFTNGINSRAAANGLMLRMGGDVLNCLHISNGMAGRDIVSGGNKSIIDGNHFCGTVDQYLPRTTGFYGGIDDVSACGTNTNNTFGNQPVAGTAIQVDGTNNIAKTQPHPWNLTITNNIVAMSYNGTYRLGARDAIIDVSNQWGATTNYRTIEEYAASCGLQPNGASFFAACRANCMGAWDKRFTAAAALAFIRGS